MSVKNKTLAMFCKPCWVLRVEAMSSMKSVSLFKRTSKTPSVDVQEWDVVAAWKSSWLCARGQHTEFSVPRLPRP